MLSGYTPRAAPGGIAADCVFVERPSQAPSRTTPPKSLFAQSQTTPPTSMDCSHPSPALCCPDTYIGSIEFKETNLGDPNFNNINFDKILSDEFIQNLISKINIDKVYDSKKSYVTSNPETIYLTVVDKDLNAVSFINSICHVFGSGITTNNSGILFQNRGVNFRLEENHPNSIQGNKRPLHTIIPGLLTNANNETILSYGVMGGQYQPIGQTHVLQNILDYNQTIQEAIDFPRSFALNGELKIEKSIDDQSQKEENPYQPKLDTEDMGQAVPNAQETVGGERVMGLLKELETARKETENSPIADVKPAPESKDIGDNIGTKSPIGSK